MSDFCSELPSHKNDDTSIKGATATLQVEEVETSDDESEISSIGPNEERNNNKNDDCVVLSSGDDDCMIVHRKKASHSSDVVMVISSSDEPKSDDTEPSASPQRKVLRARKSARSKTKVTDQPPNKAVHIWQRVAVANPQSPAPTSSNSKPTDRNALTSSIKFVASESNPPTGFGISSRTKTNEDEDFDSDSSTSSITPKPKHLPTFRILTKTQLDTDANYIAFEKMNKISKGLTKRQLKHHTPIFGMLYFEEGVLPDLSDSTGPYFCMPVSWKIIGFSNNPVIKAMRLTSHLMEYNTLSTNVNCLWNAQRNSNKKNLIGLRPCHYVRLSIYHYNEIVSLMKENTQVNVKDTGGTPSGQQDTKYTTLLFLNDEWCQRNDAQLSNFLASIEGKMANVGLTNQASYLIPNEKRKVEEEDLSRIFHRVSRGCPVSPLHKRGDEKDSIAYCYVVMPSKT